MNTGPISVADLVVQQPREFAVVEMAGGHQPQPLRFFLVRAVAILQEVPDHALDQFDQRRGRRLLAEQMRQIRIGLAFFGQDFGVERGLGRESA